MTARDHDGWLPSPKAWSTLVARLAQVSESAWRSDADDGAVRYFTASARHGLSMWPTWEQLQRHLEIEESALRERINAHQEQQLQRQVSHTGRASERER